MPNNITIMINGKQFCCAKNSTLAEVLRQYSIQNRVKTSFALAVNQCFVGKDHYQSYQVKQGDNIDILTPIVGG